MSPTSCCCQNYVECFLLKIKNHLSSPWECSDYTGNKPLLTFLPHRPPAPSLIITYDALAGLASTPLPLPSQGSLM